MPSCAASRPGPPPQRPPSGSHAPRFDRGCARCAKACTRIVASGRAPCALGLGTAAAVPVVMETTTRIRTRSFAALAVLTTLTLGFSSGARAQAVPATDPENAVVAAPGAPLPGASDDPNADR